VQSATSVPPFGTHYVGGSSLKDLAALDPARVLIVHLADVEH